jgi:hypothetical protein
MTLPGGIVIQDSDVTITLVVDDAATLAGIAELKGMIMSQSGAIAEETSLVRSFTADALARFDRLQQMIDSPTDESKLSPEATAELQTMRNILLAARQAAGLGDENNDGDPAPAAPATDSSTGTDSSAAPAEPVGDGAADNAGGDTAPADNGGDVASAPAE